ncbi:MAG TPA: hypothetical protein VFZ44_19540 [Pyrinomonadaceae bacterium]
MNSRLRDSALTALAVALFTLCTQRGAAALAQVTESRPETPTASAKEAGPPRARKIDEFGRLYGCDGGARLDNFAHYLTEEPDSTGYIFAYDARGGARLTAHFWGELLRQYLVEYRGILESRLRLVDAGERAGDDVQIEFWLVPAGAEPPAASPARGKKAARPFAGKYDDYFAFDGAQFYDTEGGSPGSFNIGVTFSALRELLRRQTESHGYVVVYPRRGAYPGYWRNVATRERQKLTMGGLDVERFTVVRGGVNEGMVKGFQDDIEKDPAEEYDRVELWVGEKARSPVRHRPEKETLEEAARVASIPAYFTDDGHITRWGLDNLFEFARTNPRSTACVIVYPDADATPDSEGKPPVDLFKLAASLKEELRRRGLEETRIVLMNGPIESYDARLELWAVPYGAALPDPFAEEDVEAEPEESEPEGESPGR